MITGRDGNPLTLGVTGVWRLTNPFNRPGVLRLLTHNTQSPITAADQGIYTCTLPDSNGDQVVFNIGLYPRAFDGKLSTIIMYTVCKVMMSYSLSCHRPSHHHRPDLPGGESYTDMCVYCVSSHHCLLDEGWTTSHH